MQPSSSMAWVCSSNRHSSKPLLHLQLPLLTAGSAPAVQLQPVSSVPNVAQRSLSLRWLTAGSVLAAQLQPVNSAPSAVAPSLRMMAAGPALAAQRTPASSARTVAAKSLPVSRSISATNVAGSRKIPRRLPGSVPSVATPLIMGTSYKEVMDHGFI